MVTGASTADAVIILIDVSKVKLGDDGSVEMLIQTKRHSTIAHLLQIEHVIVAVNKMDLVNYDQTVYDRIIAAYTDFAKTLGLKDIHAIPLSALAGDNVVTRGDNVNRSEEHTSEIQPLMRISYAVLRLNKKNNNQNRQ